jgi:hypothetical protein
VDLSAGHTAAWGLDVIGYLAMNIMHIKIGSHTYISLGCFL